MEPLEGYRVRSDEPKSGPKKWYTTQKEHWLGWLGEYSGPGAYGRRIGKNRDAQYAYNHMVQPEMLLWLITAAGVKPGLANSARRASVSAATMPGKSAAIRRHVPWASVAAALWRDNTGLTLASADAHKTARR